jgi:hypothetical protein
MMTEKPIPRTLLRSALWRRLDTHAFEHFRLQALPEEFEFGRYALEGRVLAAVDGRPMEAHYSVLCDAAWVTRHVNATVFEGRSVRHARLRRDDAGAWWRDDEAVPQVEGAVDIDLSISPSTNTLPIRRLSLAIGESKDLDAAWLRFPELAIERLPQRYTRLDAHRYRYESRGGSFVAELDVDDEGVVTRYGDIWERIASGD